MLVQSKDLSEADGIIVSGIFGAFSGKDEISEEKEEEMKERIREVKESLGLTSLGISDEERVQIVSAMGLTRGHWFKCPRGTTTRILHSYFGK